MGFCLALMQTEGCRHGSRCGKLSRADQHLQDVLTHCLLSLAPSASICLIALTDITYSLVLVFQSWIVFASVEVVFFCVCAVSNCPFAVTVSCPQRLILRLCTDDRNTLDGRGCEASNERSRTVLSVPPGKERCLCLFVCLSMFYVQRCNC